MSKNARAGVGVLLVLLGGIWTLQGFGYLSGSAMSDVWTWAIVGPIVALIGVYLVVKALRGDR